jgi:mannose-6-phosphate isomerase-like protein (cupin superfamily)
MAKVYPPERANKLGLPGRQSLEIVSGPQGSRNVSLRLVDIAVPPPGEALRGPHVHHAFEECIYVLSGEGLMVTEAAAHPLRAGDTILIPAEEFHVTRNVGQVPLVLLCFFPTPDVAKGTEDMPMDNLAPVWR